VSSTNPAESDKNMATTSAERRRNLRFPFSASVEVIETNSQTKISGRTSDLSLGGCYVDTISTFPIGTEASLRIIRENETFEAQVKVVYSTIGMGMGLAFLSAQPKQFSVFQRWLLEIGGQPVSGQIPLEETPSKESPLEAATQQPPTEKSHTLSDTVLTELILVLMQKKVLTEKEGKDLVRKLFS
jgi:hypothetical protein